MAHFFLLLFLQTSVSFAATIAIIDTGFDLDHSYLRPNILRNETDEEAINFQGWDFFDNSHLKKPAIDDKSLVQEILLYRNLKAKGHLGGLSRDEVEWFNKKNADRDFMEKVRLFKKHTHGTFVAGIALREGENINIFPIRGLHLPNPVVAIEDSSEAGNLPITGKTPEKKFEEEIRNSMLRVSNKFSKICQFIAKKKISIVNASYGITYKNIVSKFRERYRELTGNEIAEPKLAQYVDNYFLELYKRGQRTMRRYPQILFVFSAGNSGLDNDLFHHYPSRIKVPNSISVAAMNGEYLATFSNFGFINVDIGAPGVAILSIVPKVYSENGHDIYSPASGTSMAAPYVSNLAAQILNVNVNLTPEEIKRIILETGETRPHLKTKMGSGAIADNSKALRAALLSKDISLDEAINLARSNLIQMEDKVSIGIAPAISPDEMKKKVLESFPSPITPEEVDDEQVIDPTKPESSLPMDLTIKQPDSLVPLPSKEITAPEKSSDPVHSNQNGELSPQPSEEKAASSSESLP